MRRPFLPNETVYCRFTGEAFTVVECNGCVAILLDAAGNTTGRIVGEITHRTSGVIRAEPSVSA